MESIIAFLVEGTTLTIAGFSALCGISFIGSFIAASLGLGGGLLVLAAMTLFLPPTVLIPIHAVVQIGSNGFRAFLMRRDILYSVIPAFVIGTLIGSYIGGKTLYSHWKSGCCRQSLVSSCFTPPGPRNLKAPTLARRSSLAAACSAGFATMFVGGTGPLVAPFVNAACKERQQVVSTHASLMTFQHLFKVILFGVLGFSFGPYIPLLVGLVGFGVCGTIVGKRVLDKLPEKVFRIGLQTILTLLAARLLYAAVATYFA